VPKHTQFPSFLPSLHHTHTCQKTSTFILSYTLNTGNTPSCQSTLYFILSMLTTPYTHKPTHPHFPSFFLSLYNTLWPKQTQFHSFLHTIHKHFSSFIHSLYLTHSCQNTSPFILTYTHYNAHTSQSHTLSLFLTLAIQYICAKTHAL
jgi:hypothetical protein